MTALDEFQRLESPGIWKPAADAQRRDVVVTFGEATLTITTGHDLPMAHWSLAAIERLNPGQRPALFSPGDDSAETLEIDDALMIDAIEKVRAAVRRQAPHPRRLRLVAALSLTVVVLLLALFWLPGAMVRYTASVVPPAKRAEIGQAILAQVERLSGPPCETPLGRQALADLHKRLLPGTPGRIVVLRSGGEPSLHLPGGLIVVNRSVVEDYDDPEATAGFVLAEALRARATDPLEDALRGMGLGAAFQLLTTGDIARARLARYAERVLATAPEPVPVESLISAFRAAALRAAPFAYALDVSGETTVELIEADQIAPARARPVLSDGSWVSLQAICGG